MRTADRFGLAPVDATVDLKQVMEHLTKQDGRLFLEVIKKYIVTPYKPRSTLSFQHKSLIEFFRMDGKMGDASNLYNLKMKKR